MPYKISKKANKALNYALLSRIVTRVRIPLPLYPQPARLRDFYFIVSYIVSCFVI